MPMVMFIAHFNDAVDCGVVGRINDRSLVRIFHISDDVTVILWCFGHA